jgi:hypothetical protein
MIAAPFKFVTIYQDIKLNFEITKKDIYIYWKRIKKPIILKKVNNCLECHSHSLTHNGYPKITWKNKTRRLNRWFYKLIKKENIKGKVLMHTCDNRLCVNLDHLIPTSHNNNMHDMVEKERQCRGSASHLSKLCEDDIIFIRSGKIKSIENLAAIHNVSEQTIKDILNYKTWGHVK